WMKDGVQATVGQGADQMRRRRGGDESSLDGTSESERGTEPRLIVLEDDAVEGFDLEDDQLAVPAALVHWIVAKRRQRMSQRPVIAPLAGTNRTSHRAATSSVAVGQLVHFPHATVTKL